MAALLAYYLVFYLYVYACTARLLIVSDKRFAAHLKFSSEVDVVDVETSYNKGSNDFSGQKHGNNEGESTKGLQTSNILHQATGREIRKRSMVAWKLAESVSSSKDRNTVEDIVVMDYAQPHRKPPIHNKGT